MKNRPSRSCRSESRYGQERPGGVRRGPRSRTTSRNVVREYGQLCEDELIANCILLLVAGHETVAPAIANGVKVLLEAGVSWNVIHSAEETVIEEILRFEPSLHMLYRFAKEDVAIGPAQFKKGDRIGILIGSASRDDANFPEPELFLPERLRTPHVSFGGGIHFCIGAPLPGSRSRLHCRYCLSDSLGYD